MYGLMVALLLATACVKSNAVECGGGIVCPAGATCDLERGLCITPAQLAACAGKAEGDECTFGEVAGQCYDGLCAMSTCGDSRIGPGEVCDDGNLVSGDGCRGDCRSAETCGNGLIDHEAGEQCDCGDETVALGCSDVNSLTSDAATCRPDCMYRCGDGEIEPGEFCDGTAPVGESCLDYGYDLGRLGCSTICTPGFLACEQIGWVTVDTGLTNPRFNGVWGAAANDVFGVTDSDGVMHWDGSAWSKMTVPLPVSEMHGVWGRSGTDVYAVGNSGTILHYDGSAWSAVASNTTEPLFAVSGNATTVIAVGGNVSNAVITESTNGGAFVVAPLSGYYDLHGVVVNGASATAVGRYGLMCHRPTTTWACTASITIGDLSSVVTLNATTFVGSSKGLYAGGNPADVNTFGAVIDRSFGDVGSLALYGGELFVNGDHVYRLHDGAYYQISDNTVQTLGLWVAGLDDMWAVGKLGVRRFTGTTWSSAPLGSSYHVQSISAGALGAYMVGNGNTIRYFSPSANFQFAPFSGSVFGDFVGVSVGTDLVVALESSGDVAYTMPGGSFNTFDEVLTSQTIVFADIWTLDQAHDTFAVAANTAGNPSVFRRRIPSSDWVPVGSPINGALNTIWGFSDSDIFVGGSSGTIYHWNGSSWMQQTTPIVFEIRDIWGHSPSDVWAVGQSGAILHYNGSAWTQMDSGTFATLEGIWGSGANDVFATGGTTLLHYDGTNWSPMRRSADAPISEVFGYGDLVYFGGRNGASELLIRY